MQIYETTVVIDSLQKQEEIQATLTNIEKFIKNNGGNILIQEDWGKKRLAYEINKKQYGNYNYIVFEGPSNVPVLLEKEYNLQESILTHLTVEIESRHLDRLKQKQSEQSASTQKEDKPDSEEADSAAKADKSEVESTA